MFMYDLSIILDQSQVQINTFFDISISERKLEDSIAICNIENQFKNDDMPIFSDQKSEYHRVNEFKNFHNHEAEMAEMINDIDLQKGGFEKNYEVEHRYMDFSYTIISDKVKNIDKISSSEELKFDDIFYSKLMLKCDVNNLDFYMQDSVQKIIECQWVSASKLMKGLFSLYMFMYLIPIGITLFTKDEALQDNMLLIAFIPSFTLFYIETIQMKNMGLEYFAGWNILDLFQFITFQSLQYFTFG